MIVDSLYKQPEEINIDNDVLSDVRELAEQQGLSVDVLVSGMIRDASGSFQRMMGSQVSSLLQFSRK
jgi:hypothetical protein